jgi:2-polyprenyl-3-methyl-5-hydroxy-6-metoxy-1,4-benzoquinol methylase
MIKDSLQRELDKYFSYSNDPWLRYTHRLRIDRIQKLIRMSFSRQAKCSTPIALDAGCNRGAYSITLAEAGYDVIGIDIEDEGLNQASEWAKERGLENKITFEVGDIRNINYKKSTFDLVVCSEVLEHLDNPIVGTRELYRVLKEHGTAVISMPNVACGFGLLQWAYRKSGLRSLLGKPELSIHQLQHSRYWFGNILRLLQDAGFHCEYICSTSHIPYLWSVDALLENSMISYSIPARIDNLVGKLPFLNCFGFNLIVVANKLPADCKSRRSLNRWDMA